MLEEADVVLVVEDCADAMPAVPRMTAPVRPRADKLLRREFFLVVPSGDRAERFRSVKPECGPKVKRWFAQWFRFS